MRPAFLLALLVLASGCGTSHVSVELATLAEINERLGGRRADVMMADGRRVRARDVSLSCDWVSIPKRGLTAQTRTELVPIDSVAQVWTTSKSGWGRGALIGAAPGAALVGLGFYGAATCGDSLACLGNGVAVVAGAGLAAGGALIGGAVGALVARRRHTLLYDGALTDTTCASADVIPP